VDADEDVEVAGTGTIPVGEPGTAVEDGLGGALAAAVVRAEAFLAMTRAPGVTGEDPWPEAGRKVLRFHLARMLVRVPGVIAGEDPEEVHAMRVASRRMRAAWRVFGDGFDKAATRRRRADLREVGGRLGSVRDLDVLLEILDGYGARRTARVRRGLLPLRAAWVVDRQGHYAALVEHVASPSFAGFVAEHEALVAGHVAPAGAEGADRLGTVGTRMPSTAWAAFGHVRSFEDGIAEADLARLHRLRIEGRWLRYTLESVREAMGPDASLVIEPVVALQDHLGVQHDLHVAAALAGTFAVSERDALSAKEAAQVVRFIADLEERVAWYGRRLSRAWVPVSSPAYRARLGRALARL
jgi:CHAD domain-containing protein